MVPVIASRNTNAAAEVAVAVMVITQRYQPFGNAVMELVEPAPAETIVPDCKSNLVATVAPNAALGKVMAIAGLVPAFAQTEAV